MSDSVANLTVKVDTKSVSAAVQALDKLAAVAAKVEKSVGNIGAASAKQSQSAQSLEKWASKSESAFAKMEKRLEEGAKKYEQITRLVNKHALAEGMRTDSLSRSTRAFERFNRVVSDVNVSKIKLERETRLFNQTMEQTKQGIESVIKLERQRATALKQKAAEVSKSAKEQAAAAKAAEADELLRDRRLAFSAKRHSELTEAINKSGVALELRRDITSRAEAAQDRYNRVMAQSNVSAKEAQITSRMYKDEMDSLGKSLGGAARLEKQKAAEVSKSAKEQAAAAKAAEADELLRDRRLAFSAKRHSELTEAINKSGVALELRRDITSRAEAAQDRYNRVMAQSNVSAKEAQITSRMYKDEMDGLQKSLANAVLLEKQRMAETRKNAKEIEAIGKKRAADEITLERILQQAQTRVAGITGRAGRQLSAEQFSSISSSAIDALNKYTSAMRTYGVGTIGATKATGEFNRAMQSLSGDIARVGGLLPRISDNARVFSAAFGAANASMGGFSRLAFNTTAALSALAGAFGLREIIQAGFAIEQFINTLKTVSENTLGFQRNLNFLFAEADRVGFAVGQVGGSFARLSLAMKGAGFQGEETRETFTNLVSASRNFGISSADTMGVIRALEQSMSKGKFMAEEVRLQLGDRLPVAMAALERAVTKVDGKQSDLNKRFEEGSLDVKRYGVEFARQIFELSGGADALGRTSQTVQSAFARVNNELVKTNMLFKESGFDAALISVSAQLERIIVAARESGAVEGLAKSFQILAENIDLVAGALAALSLLALPRIAATLLSKWTLIAAALAGIGALAASLFRGPERDLRNFEKSVQSFESTYKRLKNNIDSVNQSLAQGASSAASSAESSFERLTRSYEKMGESAARAVSLALRAEIMGSEKEIAKLRQEQQKILAGAESISDRVSVAVQGIGAQIARTGRFSEDQLKTVNGTLGKLVEDLKQGRIDANQFDLRLTDLLKGLGLFEATALGASQKGIRPLFESVSDLKSIFAEEGNFKFFENLRGRVTQIAERLASAVSLVSQLRQQEAAASRGMLPTPGSNEPFTPNEPADLPVYALPGRLRFTPPEQARRAAAAQAVLQVAYKETMKTSTDATKVEIERFEASLRAREGDAVAVQILKAYDDAMKGKTASTERGTAATERSTETLDKYLATLRAQIENQDRIAAAYRISTQAGEDAELQLKAETEAIRLGAKTDAQRIALKKQILPLLQDEAAGEASIRAAKDLPQMRDEIALLEKEQSLLGASVALREQELAVLRARQQYRGAKPEDLAEIEQNTRRTVELRQQNQFLENSYNEVANIGTRAFEQVGDAITEAFSKGELRALRFGDIVRGVMSSIIQSIIRLGVINPIIKSIFPGAGAMLPTLGAGLSVLGGGGVAGAAGAAGGGGSLLGGLGQLFSAGRTAYSALTSGSLMAGAGGFAGYGSGMSGVLFGTPALAPGGFTSAGAAATSGLLGSGGQFSMAALGSTLGLAAGGFGAGTFANSLLGGNQTSGMIGSAIGTGIGLALTPILGPFAPILSGLLGGGLGGVFGPKPSSKGFSYNLGTQGGRLAPIDYRYFNEQGRAQFQEAEAGVAATNALLQQFGLTATGGRAVGGNRFGMGNLGYGEAASFSEAFKSLQFAATSNEELSRALSTRAFEGVEKLQEFLQGFVGLQETIKSLTADPVPEFTQQMDALINSFAEATAKAREYGIGEEELLVARDKQIARLEEQRNLTIRDTALELEVRRLMAQGMDQEADRIELAYRTQKEIESFTASLETLGITAGEKSRLLIELEEVQALERAKILKESTKDIRDYLDSLKTGPLAGTTLRGRLESAQDLFSRDLTAAQSGDAEALGRITQSADVLLNLARQAHGAAGGYENIRTRVVSGLETLLAVSEAAPPLADLSSVPLVSELRQMRDEAAILEAVQYSKQFDEKLGSLLPIAEAIQQAVEQSKEAAVALYDYVSAGGESGDMGSGSSGGGQMGFEGNAMALGGVFHRGRVTAYANGGIPDLVNSPTLAPMALFGEAGPEAIMPLRRGPDGRLGVEVSGSGSEAVVTELRAVREEIINLRGSVEEADNDEGGGVVEAIAELRIQIGGLREELRTNRLRAQ